LKKIISVMLAMLMLTNVYAVQMTENFEREIDNEQYIYRVYEMTKEEEKDFKYDEELKIENKNYILSGVSTADNSYTDTVDIKTTKQLVSDTNNKQKILELFPATLKYSKDGFVGEYKLNTESLEVERVYNGYKEYLVDKTVEYNNLPKNDLSYIPKQIEKDDWILDLITTTWQVEDTVNIGGNEVANEYTAKCYYATKYKKDNPYTYTCKAEYTGTAKKEVEGTIEYHLEYKFVNEDNNIVPIVVASTSGSIFVILLIISSRRVKVYGLSGYQYKYLGKVKYNKKNQEVDISSKAKKIKTNTYKIIIPKAIHKTLKNKCLKVTKDSISKHICISLDDDNKFQINI